MTAHSPQTVFLDTALVENDKAVRLESVIYRPDGNGPFPVLIVNHGSTGNGDQPSRFTETFHSAGIASFFNRHGWLVVFPQRRGRGKSDGLYDEGFREDRALGYSANPALSIPGAERALSDVDAALEALSPSDMDSANVVMAGISRGGILSIAYAGRHPDKVKGVVNFVGGWISDGAGTASRINQTIFGFGTNFKQKTLWLYGHDDPFYAVAHSKQNFDAFVAAGGKGTFHEFQLPQGSGHVVHEWPDVWQPPVRDYMCEIGYPGFSETHQN